MPRIDPLQLLKCLSVLLRSDGGILSQDEVPRLVNLMTKFSKKLVSKCVYVLILKNTESNLVDMFMGEGGWALIQTWLQDAMHMSNWDLVTEIVGLLLMTPVDVERLKLNNIPKLIKSLSRREDLPAVQQLTTQLVQQWLVIVKGSSQVAPPAQPVEIKVDAPAFTENVDTAPAADNLQINNSAHNDKDAEEVTEHIDQNDSNTISANSFYKPSKKDCKEGTCKELEKPVDTAPEAAVEETVDEVSIIEAKEKTKDDEKKTSDKKDRSKSSSSSKSSTRSTKSSSDKSKSSSSSSSKNSSSSKDKDRSREKDRDRKDRDKDKDKHRNNGSVKHSSSSSKSLSSSNSKDKDKKELKDKDLKESKEKQAEKDKDTLAKIKPQSIDKLGRIPKRLSLDDKFKDKEVKKKPSMSIEVRKNSEDRPKTVKIFNSKMRSTGLEEEVKPPPPRTAKKPSVPLPTLPVKRPSPPRTDPVVPPEKKIKVDTIDKPERPGAIKLIPPKPKPIALQESDMFMDALTASATAKKEPKKRKRRPSVSKETPSSPTTTGDQSQTPSSPSVSSPLGLKNIAPINFYQDTFNDSNAEGEKENPQAEENKEETEEKDRPATPTDVVETEPSEITNTTVNEDGLKGVLCHGKRKGPKRTISWKADADLVEVRFFELDETERVNVTKTFTDMARMEMSSEREALMSRKLFNEDVMEPQTMWRLPFVIDQAEPLTPPGTKSLEKDIQFAREKTVLPAFYYDKRRIPDSPEEPIPENHQMSDPVIIPLDDPECQEIDLRNTPWPEPKGSPPHVEPPMPQQIFPNVPTPFNPNFQQQIIPPPAAFQGLPPRFNGPSNHVPNNFGPPNLMPNGNMMGPPNMGPPPPEMMHQGPAQINPAMFGPGPGPDNYGPMNDNFPMPFNQHNMNNMNNVNTMNNMNMFPPNNFNMNRSGNENRSNNFNRRSGGRGNNAPWGRMNGPSWGRGGGHRGGRFCKNVKNHGYCRNRDNCPFVHPN